MDIDIKFIQLLKRVIGIKNFCDEFGIMIIEWTLLPNINEPKLLHVGLDAMCNSLNPEYVKQSMSSYMKNSHEDNNELLMFDIIYAGIMGIMKGINSEILINDFLNLIQNSNEQIVIPNQRLLIDECESLIGDIVQYDEYIKSNSSMKTLSMKEWCNGLVSSHVELIKKKWKT